LTSKTIRAVAGPEAAPISTRTSPFLPPPSAPSAPVWEAESPRADATASTAAKTRSLEVEPLAGARCLGLGERLVALGALDEDADLLLEAGDLALHPARLRPVALGELASLLAMDLAKLLDLLAMAILGLEELLDGSLLDRGQWAVLGGQGAVQLLLLVARGGHEHLLDLALDRIGTLDVEPIGDPAGDLGAALVEGLGEITAQLPDLLLEHPLHVVDVGGGALGVDDPGADLDRLGDRLRCGGTGLGPLPDDVRGAFVGDGQRFDQDPVAERANRRFLLQGQLRRRVEPVVAGRFHRTHQGSRGPGCEPDVSQLTHEAERRCKGCVRANFSPDRSAGAGP
jgi:hypothetical protein